MNAMVNGAAASGEYLALLRRRRGWIIAFVPASVLLSALIAYLQTPQYQSSATVSYTHLTLPTIYSV